MAIRTLINHAHDRKRKSRKMRKSQALVPFSRYMDNGIFKSDSAYIKTWEFENINFKLLSKEQEDTLLRKWCETLNSLEPGTTYKYVVLKKKLDLKNYESERLIEKKGDEYDVFRDEYNRMLREKVIDTKLIDEKRYFQVAINRRKFEDAASFFNRTTPEIEKAFRNVGSTAYVPDANDFLGVLWNFLHMDSEDFYNKLSGTELTKKNIKDYLAPYSFTTNNSQHYIQIGDTYFRCLYVPPNSYAKYIKDTVLDELTSLNKSMCAAIDIMPLESTESYATIEALEFKSETNIANFMERQARHGNIAAQVPYTMRKKAEQIEEYNHDLNERDQRLMLGHITILHCATSLAELNEDTDALKTAARTQGCELTELAYEQEDGFVTALPYGINRFIDKRGSRLRTLTTEAMASFIPFTVKEVSHKNGIYYGQNKITKNPIFIDRKSLMNGNAVFFGSSGSGKSFKEKMELINAILATGDNVIIIDPEKEYTHLIQKMGGEVIKMSADSTDHINAMDISDSYADGENPVTLKAESLLTLYAMAEGAEKIDPGAKSILDRCIKNVYADYVADNFLGNPPTLNELRNELLNQHEELAEKIALTLELYTTGSLNLFSKKTNVNMSNRLISFDISELGENLMPIAMLIITDFIMLTLSNNRKAGKYTYVVIDELYLMFMKEYTATFFHKLWKRIRKYGGLCTGLTQELSDLMKSPTARTLLSNSEFLILLSADKADSMLIQELLGLDDSQMDYITEVGSSNGMIKLGDTYIPFTDNFPKDTSLYKIMSTKPSEVKYSE